MTAIQFSGKWEGHYAYGPQYPVERQKERIGFFADLTVEEGILKGFCEEYVTKVHMKKPAMLDGFIEENAISFVKKYPFYYSVDENKEISVDFTRPSHSVRYSGLYDPVSGLLSGEWEIEAARDGDACGEPAYLVTGTWQMRKV
jgi:hypothetical protein